MVNYYAVKIGKKPGIYLSWDECKENVNRFSKAQYKKFESKIEAENYMNDHIKNTTNHEKVILNTEIQNYTKAPIINQCQIVDDNYDFANCINVYTDGSCINNGTVHAVAGCGIYFGENDNKNISFKLKKKNDYDNTNNRAELKAILKAIKILKSHIENNKIVIIHTDSQYSMTCFTSTTITKKKVDKIPNYDYVIKGNNLCKSHLNIKFHHVKAHTSNKDIHSIGNDNADRLANLAIINDIGKIILSFGKYANMNLEEIYMRDKKYLHWCIQNIKTQMHDIKLFLEVQETTFFQPNINVNNKEEIEEIEEFEELERQFNNL